MPRKLSQTPQARWSRKMIRRGRCRICGQKRTKFKQLCDYHQGIFNTYMRAYRLRHRPTVSSEVSA